MMELAEKNTDIYKVAPCEQETYTNRIKRGKRRHKNQKWNGTSKSEK